MAKMFIAALMLTACDAFIPSSSNTVRSAVQPKQQVRTAAVNSC